jgi:hypothetical protein
LVCLADLALGYWIAHHLHQKGNISGLVEWFGLTSERY